MIGDEIEISVVSIQKGKVFLGIDAPRSVPLYREEVHAERQERAAEDDPAD